MRFTVAHRGQRIALSVITGERRWKNRSLLCITSRKTAVDTHCGQLYIAKAMRRICAYIFLCAPTRVVLSITRASKCPTPAHILIFARAALGTVSELAAPDVRIGRCGLRVVREETAGVRFVRAHRWRVSHCRARWRRGEIRGGGRLELT